MINKVGSEIAKNSKKGGGKYIVVAHVNCERCDKVIEEREVESPTKVHRKSGKYYSRYSWCHSCGLYNPDPKSKKYVNRFKK